MLDRLSTGFEWAVAPEAKLVVGDVGDSALVGSIIREHKVDAIIHFAGSIVVPESVADPLGYYENNTCQDAHADRSGGARQACRISSSPRPPPSMAAPGSEPVREDAPLQPESPYGRSKLMTRMDAARRRRRASGLRYTALRYFNVAGADPQGPHRPVDAGRHASDQGRLRDRARQAAVHAGLRHRLSDAGRHLHPRLHPCQRSRRRASAGACSGCAPAAAAWSPIAATATAIRCWR